MPIFSRPSICSVGAALRSCGLTLIVGLCQPRIVRAEDSLTYKFQSWQEDHERIRVDSHYILAEKDLGADTHLKAMGLIDSITGATPTGELPANPNGKVPLAQMDDLRRAWSFDLSHQFKRINLAADYAVSRESDYVSNGWSLNALTDFNQKNTNLLLGYGRTDDTIKEPKLGWTIDRDKAGNDYIAGFTQLIDANTSGSVNLSYGRSSGFLSDPYKIVSTTKLDLDPGFYYTPPENRPRSKDRLSMLCSLNRNFEKAHGALEATYRYYHDTFGITSHTGSLRWIQELGSNFIVEPSIRLARQSAADFYYYDLDRAGVVTTFEPTLGETGTGTAPFYSSDYRLSCMQTVDLGLKFTWKIKSWVWIDIAYSRYVARGLDHLTPQDVYAKADVFTVGFKLFH